MPSYEFCCQDCGNRFEVFMSYNEYGKKEVACSKCGSENITRKIGRIRFARSEESRMDDFSDMGDLEGLEEDPRSLGKMMRKMSNELGEEMPAEFKEVVGRLEAGESPEQIEKELPDLGMGESSSGEDFGSGLDDD